jgi:O-antigen/teichoic acid export membrane protein
MVTEKTQVSSSHVAVVLTNSWWNILNYIFSAAGGLLVSVFFARALGVDGYGLYALIFSIATVSSLFLDFGLAQIISKYVPRYYNDRDNVGLVRKIIVSAIFFQCATWILLFIGLSLFGESLLQSVGVGDSSLLVTGSYIIALLVLPTLLSRLLSAFFVAIQQSRYAALTTLITQLGVLFGGLVMMVYGASVQSALIVQVVSVGLGTLFACIALLQLRFKAQSSVKQLLVRDIASYGSLAYLNTILVFIVWSYSEVFFLNHYWGQDLVGYYTIAVSLGSLISAVPGLFLRSVYTSHFELVEKGEEKRAEAMLETAVLWMTAIFIPFSVLLTALAVVLIPFVYGSAYQPIAYVLPLVLFGSVISTTIAASTIRANTVTSAFGVTVVITAFGAVCNLAIDYLLIPTYGLIGAGLASFSSQLLLTAITMLYVFRRFSLSLPWLRLVRIYSISLGYGALVVLLFSLPLIIFVFAILALLVVAWYFIFDPRRMNQSDRALITQIANSLPPAVAGLILRVARVHTS